MILAKKFYNFNSTLLTNLVFSFFPISFIFGNFVTNLNIILFCGFGIFVLRSKILKIKFNIYIKIIFFLFFWIFLSTALSFIKSLYLDGYDDENLIRLIKSITFFRFFLMLIIIYFLNEFEILNFKYFFVTAAFSSLFISLDIIYQYLVGFNIIGLKSRININSGFFGEELIAGGFIQDFAFFSIFFVACLLKNKSSHRYLLTTIAICTLGMGIFLSGNRMPLILFLLGLFIIFIFYDRLRLIMLLGLIILFAFFQFIILSNVDLKKKYNSIYNNIIIGEAAPRIPKIIPKGILSKFPSFENYIEELNELNRRNFFRRESVHGLIVRDTDELYSKYFASEGSKIENPPETFYGESANKRLILTAIDTWSRNKITGNGMKSFRINCKDDLKYILQETTALSKNKRLCSSHPHNYYIEILTETGIIGLSLIILIAALFIVFIFKNLKFLKGNNLENFLVLSAVISLILEAFPIQHTGSFFTTNDATYIILISSIILINRKINIKKIYNQHF